MTMLNWKLFEGVKYAVSESGFIWVIWPGNLKGQFHGTEEELKKRIMDLKNSK